ncbi:hypothetical protein DSM3645_30221 [Blastopirellula marina DSM 3645]|uniref:Uncharacterized protein n=1 Tax=Blastopirellula marina DSM 3645 TaxID=314230 RepID=A3ZX98_9BACT|nr:hypothetical protein DSM3645_30221 [Blastopirellula marina DSM 3645]
MIENSRSQGNLRRTKQTRCSHNTAIFESIANRNALIFFPATAGLRPASSGFRVACAANGPLQRIRHA